MNIGQAAEASGVSAKMIRYYENIGLLPEAYRSASGYRKYSAADIHRLKFVRRARDFGFPMAQIVELLALWSDRARPSSEVKRIALAHMDELDAKIKHLRALQKSLKTLASHCHGDERPDCPILEELEH
ncbi:MAG: Cu(I)-responsive transcriptional regulator [Rhizobiales bacterium]|nr:Cu(I)-responsive transcriptional regulator [Hyphomicrobiales bacterium]